MTSHQTGRNDLCPCGSGKKFKACCLARGPAQFEKRRIPLFVILLIVSSVVVVGATMIIRSTRPARPAYDTPQSEPSTSNAGSGSRTTPPPAGPTPPGKIWAPEHGHWHDDPNVSTPSAGSETKTAPAGVSSQSPGASQPPGAAPLGKVWSPEHGHWHDDPGVNVPPPGSGTKTALSGSESKNTNDQETAIEKPVNDLSESD
jgi:hypothetical protein